MSHKGQISPRTVTLGLRQRAWWVMRRRLSFTLTDLLATLADGTERDASNNIGKYIRALKKAGIIKCEARRQAGSALTSPGMLRYQLVVNSGRKAPVWRAKTNSVYDPNSDTVYSITENLCPGTGEVSHE